MTITRPLAALALVVLLGATTTSCAEDEPEPIMPSSPSSSPSTSEPTSEPTAEPTSEPTEPWQKKSFDGAEAFATHWFDVFSEAMPTGDTSEMREISDPECANCNSFAELLEGWYEDGGFYKSEGWKVRQATYIRPHPLAKAQVGLSIFQSRARVKESADSMVDVDTSGTRVYEAELRWTDGRWLMFRFEPIA